MTRQTSQPIEALDLSSTNRQVRELVNLVRSGDMTLDAPYQRPSLWSEDQRINIVLSWLQRTPIPAIIINDRGNSRWTGTKAWEDGGFSYAVIDGKQRMEAAVAWFTDDLAVPASWFPADEIEQSYDTDDGPYVTVSCLTVRGQRLIAQRAMIPVAEGSLSSEAAEAALYVQVNTSGTPQSDGAIANAQQIADGNR